MRIRALIFIAIALVLAQASFGGTVSSCFDTSSYTGGDGLLYNRFTCSLYNDFNSYTINLTPVETNGGAPLLNNAVGAGYFVVINGNPNTLPDDSLTGDLLDRSLWQTVLYFSVDSSVCSICSDSLTVDWSGAFPMTSTILSLDDSLYPGNPDSAFFIASTGVKTVFTPNPNNEYDIYKTPEPGTIVLLGSSLALLGGAVLRRRRTAGRAA